MNLPLSPSETTPATTGHLRSTEERDALLALMSFVVLAGFVVAIAYHYVVGMYAGHLVYNVAIPSEDGPPQRYQSVYIGAQYPANTFLFRPFDMFNDFKNLYVLFHNPDLFHSQPFRWNHFPFAFVALLPYYYLLTPIWGIVVRELLILVPFLAISVTQLRGATRFDTYRNAVLFSTCTYPFLFALDRANNEADIFLLLTWFVFLLKSGNTTWSVLPLSLALALKPYAAVFLPLFVIERMSFVSLIDEFKRKGIFAAMLKLMQSCAYAAAVPVTAFVLNIASIPVLVNAVSYPAAVLPEAWKQTIDMFVVGDEGVPFNNSLWAVLKLFLYSVCRAGDYSQAVRAVMSPYRTSVLLAFIAICAYAWMCERTFWKRVALMVCSLNLFPYVSADYKLLHVFIPLWLFVNSRNRDRFDYVYAIIFALLLIPKNYVRFAAPGMGEANLGVVLNPLLMLALVVIIIASGLRRFSQCRWSLPPNIKLSTTA